MRFLSSCNQRRMRRRGSPAAHRPIKAAQTRKSTGSYCRSCRKQNAAAATATCSAAPAQRGRTRPPRPTRRSRRRRRCAFSCTGGAQAPPRRTRPAVPGISQGCPLCAPPPWRRWRSTTRPRRSIRRRSPRSAPSLKSVPHRICAPGRGKSRCCAARRRSTPVFRRRSAPPALRPAPARRIAADCAFV